MKKFLPGIVAMAIGIILPFATAEGIRIMSESQVYGEGWADGLTFTVTGLSVVIGISLMITGAKFILTDDGRRR